jgi:hypothetical protein
MLPSVRWRLKRDALNVRLAPNVQPSKRRLLDSRSVWKLLPKVVDLVLDAVQRVAEDIVGLAQTLRRSTAWIV